MDEFAASAVSCCEIVLTQPPFVFPGSTSSFDRGRYVDEFDRNDQVRAFLLSSLAGGVGINLVSSPSKRGAT